MTAFLWLLLQLSTPLATPSFAVDIDGDGQVDRVRPVVADGSLWLDVWHAEHGGYVLRSTQRVRAYKPGLAETWLVRDVDGDGRQDLVRVTLTGAEATTEVWRSDGLGFSLASKHEVAMPVTATRRALPPPTREF